MLLKKDHLNNVSAASAGELFIFLDNQRAVLINYPEFEEIQEIVNENK